jgi:hypothetical protein
VSSNNVASGRAGLRGRYEKFHRRGQTSSSTAGSTNAQGTPSSSTPGD